MGYCYPVHMGEGKATDLCLSVVVTTKIAKSRHLSIRATRKRIQSVKISKKLAWMFFESFGMVHERHK